MGILVSTTRSGLVDNEDDLPGGRVNLELLVSHGLSHESSSVPMRCDRVVDAVCGLQSLQASCDFLLTGQLLGNMIATVSPARSPNALTDLAFEM